MGLGKKIFLVWLPLTVLIFISMALFSFFRKTPATTKILSSPYKDSPTNLIYNLLFCDDLALYKTTFKEPITYPFTVLFTETSSVTNLQKITADSTTDPRVKILAYNRLLAVGHKPNKKVLLSVIVEVGLDKGLDVLASFENGTARYINQTGKILIWEKTDEMSNKLTKDLFLKGTQIVNQIGPWNKPRRPCPATGNARITFLVSDGFYFGEGPVDVLFNDPVASPALTSATQLMKYLTEETASTGQK